MSDHLDDLTGTVPLSVLFDRMAMTPDGREAPRDEAFVRAFSDWLAGRAGHVSLDVASHFELEDVVATFHMNRRVKLVVTGYPPAPFVGDVTLQVDERDFPHVGVTLHETPLAAPYAFCTMDYLSAGRAVTVTGGPHAGKRGTLRVAATIGLKRELRIVLADGHEVTVAADHAAEDGER